MQLLFDNKIRQKKKASTNGNKLAFLLVAKELTIRIYPAIMTALSDDSYLSCKMPDTTFSITFYKNNKQP